MYIFYHFVLYCLFWFGLVWFVLFFFLSFVIAAGRTGREVRWDPIYPVDPVCLSPPSFPSPPVPATESIPLKPLRQKSVLTPAIPLSPPPVRASNPQASETT